MNLNSIKFIFRDIRLPDNQVLVASQAESEIKISIGVLIKTEDQNHMRVETLSNLNSVTFRLDELAKAHIKDSLSDPSEYLTSQPNLYSPVFGLQVQDQYFLILGVEGSYWMFSPTLPQKYKVFIGTPEDMQEVEVLKFNEFDSGFSGSNNLNDQGLPAQLELANGYTLVMDVQQLMADNTWKFRVSSESQSNVLLLANELTPTELNNINWKIPILDHFLQGLRSPYDLLDHSTCPNLLNHHRN